MTTMDATFLRSMVRRLRRRLRPSGGGSKLIQAWSIGIMTGPSPFELADMPGVVNPILTRHEVSDVPATFVADPFMVRRGTKWFMFFEVLNRNTGRGLISVAVSDDGVHWVYEGVVLEEPFHLSYPYVFEWSGEYFMIPESESTGQVRLFQAQRFPREWRFVATLLDGRAFGDSSIFERDGRWWMFSETSPVPRFDALRLYHADSLFGPWLEHPRSPVFGDPHGARSAGRVVLRDGRVTRFAQDCHPVYGRAVRAFEVTQLTAANYVERRVRPDPVLGPSGHGWNAHGMHHVDAHPMNGSGWLACVDGFVWTPWKKLTEPRP